MQSVTPAAHIQNHNNNGSAAKKIAETETDRDHLVDVDEDSDEDPDGDSEGVFGLCLHKTNYTLVLAKTHAEYRAEWEKDGGRLRQAWTDQLDMHNKKKHDWPAKAQNDGCVGCTLHAPNGKCHHTRKDGEVYAFRSCWNNNRLCIAWDADEEDFWLRPLLPAARKKGYADAGPFALETFRSMTVKPLRNQTFPPLWEE